MSPGPEAFHCLTDRQSLTSGVSDCFCMALTGFAVTCCGLRPRNDLMTAFSIIPSLSS